MQRKNGARPIAARLKTISRHSIRIGRCVSDKGLCFEQMKLFPLAKGDVRHSVSITSLALLAFEAVTVTYISTKLVSPGFPSRCLWLHCFVVYVGTSKLRRFKKTERNWIKKFLTSLGSRSVKLRSCKGYFSPEATCETPLKFKGNNEPTLYQWISHYFHTFCIIISKFNCVTNKPYD